MLLSQIFYAIINLNDIPSLWKRAEVKMISKPGKLIANVSSHRLFSLPTVVNNRKILPRHQFEFRKGHSTLNQIHRMTNIIKIELESEEICSPVFLDVSKLCSFAI